LDAVAKGDGEWDTEYASICNAVFPFDRCFAHLGNAGWGRDSVSFGGLQVRVYELSTEIPQIKKMIDREGWEEANRITGWPADLKHDATDEWHHSVFTYDLHYSDYGGTAHVDIRVRRFGERTIAFVFMYAFGERHAESIEKILKSFRWAGTRPS
jgi:hypothetical protein